MGTNTAFKQDELTPEMRAELDAQATETQDNPTPVGVPVSVLYQHVDESENANDEKEEKGQEEVTSAPANSEQDAAAKPSTAADTSKTSSSSRPTKPLYRAADRDIYTAEDLAEYTRKLEESQIALAVTGTAPAPAQTTNISAEDDVSETDLILNPKQAITKIAKKVKQDLVNEQRAETEKAKQKQLFWDNFYRENPDLANAKDVVEFTLFRIADQYDAAKTPASRAHLLASEARVYLKKLRRDTDEAETSPARTAPSLNAARAKTPKRTENQGDSRPATYVDQFKRIHGTRRRLVN